MKLITPESNYTISLSNEHLSTIKNDFVIFDVWFVLFHIRGCQFITCDLTRTCSKKVSWSCFHSKWHRQYNYREMLCEMCCNSVTFVYTYIACVRHEDIYFGTPVTKYTDPIGSRYSCLFLCDWLFLRHTALRVNFQFIFPNYGFLSPPGIIYKVRNAFSMADFTLWPIQYPESS